MRDLMRVPMPRAATAALKRVAGWMPARLNRAVGLRYESRFWRRHLETRGLGWARNFDALLDPDAPLTEGLILDRLASLPETISILDVGAGPLTVLGKNVPGRRLEMTAVDPLGDSYRALLERNGMVAPVPTLPCAGEDLLRRFGENRFDVSFARNALDHSRDPLEIIRNMLAVTRPGGFVALRHMRREGERRGYTLLHAWNFDLAQGEPVLFNRRKTIRFAEAVPSTVRTEGHLDGHWVCIVLTKPA
jgi:SAM-dependent methyltransferase